MNLPAKRFLRQSAVAAAGLMIAFAPLAQAAQSEDPARASETKGGHQSTEFAVLPEDRWPGRLTVGDAVLDDFVAIGEEVSTGASWTARVFQSVSVPTLQIRAQWRQIGAATEYIPTLVNNGPKPSGRVNEVRSLAASWPTRGPVDFYGSNGCRYMSLEDFGDRTELDIGTVQLIPYGGQSSGTILPFFALSDRHDSLALGIGWSGQWCAILKHTANTLQVEVGLPNVGFVLRPWESVRLPSVLLARAPGASADQARRLVRSHLTKHVVPKGADGRSPNLTAHGTVHRYIHLPEFDSDEAREFENLERAAALGVELYWIDACWFGTSPTWNQEIGNWNVRRSDFPRGLRPISDRAHELGMKFVFWMEPERANPNSEWVREHPDLFLSFPDNNNPEHVWRHVSILNLGDPRGVDLAFNKISSLITEFNADIYRQDFNSGPLEVWYAEDAPNRVGITEIRWIEGLYALWDRILAAHPGILIDNCASGGHRIDLEALRRSVVFWRSDIAAYEEGIANINIINQIQCWGLGHWLPDHSGPARSFDAYSARSALTTGLMLFPHRGHELPTDENSTEYADVLATIAENKRLRPLIEEERIGLIAPELEKEAWMAFQHHRHSDSSGIIVALRGPGADSDSVTLSPEHIDANATYQVTRWDDYRAAPPAQIAGAALTELAVTIVQKRSSVLLEYQPVDD